jgi:hypothetical protein
MGALPFRKEGLLAFGFFDEGLDAGLALGSPGVAFLVEDADAPGPGASSA